MRETVIGGQASAERAGELAETSVRSGAAAAPARPPEPLQGQEKAGGASPKLDRETINKGAEEQHD